MRSMAKRRADAFFRSLRSSDAGFAATVSQYGLASARTDTFLVRDRVGNAMPPYSAFAYAALEAPKVYNELLTPPVESDGVIYVIHVLYRSDLDAAAFQQQSDGIRDRIYQRKVQEYIAYWYEELRENSEIEDYRGAL